MKELDRFDEIARQKLAERSFAFDEEHWKAVEASLPGRKRQYRGWWWISAVLLLLAPAPWLWNMRTKAPISMNGTASYSGRSGAGGVSAVSAHSIDEPQEGTRPTTEEGRSAESDGTLDAGTSRGDDDVEIAHRSTPDPRQTASSVNANPTDGTPFPGIAMNHVDHAATEPDQGDGRSPAATIAAQRPPAREPDPLTSSIEPDHQPENEGSMSATFTSAPDHDTTSMAPDQNLDKGAMAWPTPAPVAPTPSGMANEAPTPVSTPEGSAKGSAATALTIALADTARTPEGNLLPPTSNGRWELSLLGGGFSTLYHYDRNNGMSPGLEFERASAGAYGAELMQMGAHFGIGGGLHVSSYPERIRANELSTTEQFSYTHWFLSSIDTTVMVVVDTVLVGGEVFFVTEQQDTSFLVLGSEVLTNTLVHQQREARELVNRVSYVEVPLLFDMHERLGRRWNVGLRGGPTIAFLATARGALPYPTGDGYFDLQRDRLRPVVFGYMARVYVRYALSDAWAIGIEPAVKGQFTPTLTDAGPDRRSSSLGAFLSLTYRLP